MTTRVFKLCCWLLLCAPTSYAKECDQYHHSNRIKSVQLWADFNFLASDYLEGRKTQTHGAQLAREYIQKRFSQIGLLRFDINSGFLSPFVYQKHFTKVEGVNVVGYLPGSKSPESYIVVTAHYDHLGKQGRKIFNGADDNASGVAAILSIAAALSINRPQHSVIFVATDSEEKGLYGAKAFVQNPPIDLSKIKANLNLDMLSQHRGKNRLYVSGSRHFPNYQTLIRQAKEQAGLCLVSGHRSVQRGSVAGQRQSWRKASDHAAFTNASIPAIFIGVSEHAYYHTEQDTVDKTRPEFFFAAVDTSLKILRLVDELE
ncbi:M28 family peptidase [Aliiglaciecola litoralis]|uniref:M20/M25/M40 family metallo-hydrolase n=1 Tax=Aliiglaciecola litoralis TaxID=582857 RepID=A0ABP3X7F2_9ALTE